MFGVIWTEGAVTIVSLDEAESSTGSLVCVPAEILVPVSSLILPFLLDGGICSQENCLSSYKRLAFTAGKLGSR